MAEMSIEQQQALARARARQRAQDKSYQGRILPFSRDAEGDVSFDPFNAGPVQVGKDIAGAAWDAATLPGDVYAGKIDPLSTEGIDRAVGLGLFATPMNPGVRIGDKAIPGVEKNMVKRTPTSKELKEAGGKGFDTVRGMGVHYDPQSVTQGAFETRLKLEAEGILPQGAPKAYEILNGLSTVPSGASPTVPITGLIAARRGLDKAAKDFNNPTEQAAASVIRSWIDEVIEGSDPSRVVAGPATAASRVYKEANANYAAGKRSEQLGSVERSSELRARSRNSGQNVENLLRQKAFDIIDPLKPKNRRGFSAEELDRIQKVSDGTASVNTLRWFGNMLGGGGGLGATAATGTTGGFGYLLGLEPTTALAVGVAAPAIGYGLKKGAAAGTRKNWREADTAVRQRSPLYDKMPLDPRSNFEREALIKSLVGEQIGSKADSRKPMTKQDYMAYILAGGA